MLDRMSLSIKNGWKDELDRTYIIYTIDQMAEDLGCSRDKAIKAAAELDSKKGIGLIERIRHGQGRPDTIYVMNFVVNEDTDNTDDTDGDGGSHNGSEGSKDDTIRLLNEITDETIVQLSNVDINKDRS